MADAAGDIVAWAVDAGLEGLSQADLMAGYCDCLARAGVPLWRASVGADRLHPLIEAQSHRWLAGEDLREEVYVRASTPEQDEEWRQSPWFRLLETREVQMRQRLAIAEGTNEFPMLARLAAQGGTDYWARIVRFPDRGSIGETRGVATSFATRDPAGFAESHLALIDATLPAFALAFKATMALDTARTLVTTYLGRDAAERILRGEIERGQVKTVRKVLWFSDLTGFTRIADSLPRRAAARPAQRLCRQPGRRGPRPRRRGAQVHGRRHPRGVRRFRGPRLRARPGCRPGRARRDRPPQPGASGGRPAGHQLHACPARGRGALGQRRQPGSARLHRGRAGGQRACPDSGDEPLARPADPGLGDLRRRLRRAAGALVSLGRYALRGVGRPQELFTLDPSR